MDHMAGTKDGRSRNTARQASDMTWDSSREPGGSRPGGRGAHFVHIQ